MTLTPLINHWWNVPLYVTARGLTTSPIPYGRRHLRNTVRFPQSQAHHRDQRGRCEEPWILRRARLRIFIASLMGTLHSMGINVEIHAHPDEVPNPIPFDQDNVHKSYDRASVERFFRILVSVDTVLKDFRARFIGKCSPGAVLLGQLRYRGDALLRPARSASSRSDGAGGVFARSIERGILAGRRGNKRPGVLFLYGSRAGRLQDLSDSTARRIVSLGSFGIHPDVR